MASSNSNWSFGSILSQWFKRRFLEKVFVSMSAMAWSFFLKRIKPTNFFAVGRMVLSSANKTDEEKKKTKRRREKSFLDINYLDLKIELSNNMLGQSCFLRKMTAICQFAVHVAVHIAVDL